MSLFTHFYKYVYLKHKIGKNRFRITLYNPPPSRWSFYREGAYRVILDKYIIDNWMAINLRFSYVGTLYNVRLVPHFLLVFKVKI